MEHHDAVQHDFASRYVSGTLAPDDRDEFEEHYLDCPACLDALESAEGLRRGLRTVAAKDRPNAGIPPVERSWGSRGTFMSAAGIAAAVAIAVGGVDLIRTHREVARLTSVATDLTGQSDRSQSVINTLSRRLDQLESAPRTAAAGQSSAPVFALTTVRGGGASTAPNRVLLSGGTDWIVLSLELDDADVSGSFRASLRDAQQRERWRDDHLIASTSGMLGIALRAAVLDEGDFTLQVDRQRPGSPAWAPAGRYSFHVLKNR
jgi:anti-sigma factor RsiW